MSEFLQQLKREDVFVKEVRTGGIAFHSYFMESIAPTLLRQLRKVGCCPEGLPGWAGWRAARALAQTDGPVRAGDPGSEAPLQALAQHLHP